MTDSEMAKSSRKDTQVQILSEQFSGQQPQLVDFNKSFSAKISVQPPQQYLYHAKYSPGCKFLFILSFNFLCIGIILATLTTCSVFMCGLSPESHIMTLNTSPELINDEGIVLDKSITVESIQDIFSELNNTAFMESEDLLLRYKQVPYSFILNYTKDQGQMQGFTINQSNQNGQVEFRFRQTDKRRSFIQPSFYNSGYWFQQLITKNYSSLGASSLVSIGTTIRNTQFDVPIISDPNSIFPIYFMNLDSFSIFRNSKCHADYSVVVRIGSAFQIPLFQLRQYEGQIQFISATFSGVFVSEKSSSYNIVSRSQIDRISITHATNTISVDQSIVTLELPKKSSHNMITYYGIVGQQKNKLTQLKSIYTTDINNKIEFNMGGGYQFSDCGSTFCSVQLNSSIFIITNGWTCVYANSKVTCM
ncbi:hypothetical protein SS50377_23600 [Spironucleus salmonicida]|uniref:Transmembrane protein n=1 Tax=Spironucleus salmonicida TaxID=348837 RepID=V6LVA8_9EUKA|nr:hypothetical protein SS50377_23600 [Spironucleus salmonicida]|eukprot:EST48582.1 Hypothetical protein SS50377_11193 [Spironucleus salmonicida]